MDAATLAQLTAAFTVLSATATFVAVAFAVVNALRISWLGGAFDQTMASAGGIACLVALMIALARIALLAAGIDEDPEALTDAALISAVIEGGEGVPLFLNSVALALAALSFSRIERLTAPIAGVGAVVAAFAFMPLSDSGLAFPNAVAASLKPAPHVLTEICRSVRG